MEREANRFKFRPLRIGLAISIAAAIATGCSQAPPPRPAYATVLSRSHSQSLDNSAFDHAYRRFSWPIEGGTLSSGFGMRNGAMHDGIDISAPSGTPVRAADDGMVIFAGRLRGYGNVVIVRHDGHYATIYGHNRTNYVREGDHVRRGQVVARVGSTGRTTGANLHFEVRRDNIARNPIGYMTIAGAPSVGASFARGGGS